MTDIYNTALSEEKSVQDTLNAQIACFATERKKKKKEQEVEFSSLSTLYEEGIKHFAERYIIIENVFGGLHCNHEIWVKDNPMPIQGINYPSWFTPYRPLFTNEDFKQLEAAHSSLPNALLKEFWEPLIWPKGGESQLTQYANRLNLMNKVSSQYTLTDSFKYFHTHAPSSEGVFKTRAEDPRTWVPAMEWFDKRLADEVKFDDIFSLFPYAERQIFKLWLGRVAVGRANHIPHNAETPIMHTARMAVVVMSKAAGIGKSTITNYLYGALNKCGFSVESFKNTQDKFGMGRAAMAHILQKDDVSEESLLNFLKSEETKILVSNGSLRVEEKFQAAETIFPRCSILLNANTWSTNYSYSLDSGIQSRIKCITTYTKAELQKHEKSLSGALNECPDLRPFCMIPWLANKYGVSIDAIMLLATRQAADYFYDTITQTDNPSVNALEEEVYKHTSKLRYRFKNDVLGSLVQALTLSSAIMALLRDEEPFLPEFNFRMLYELCKDFYFLSVDPSTTNYCTLLKDNWVKLGSTTTHPYQALRDIRLDTLKQALECAQDSYINSMNSNITVRVTEGDILKQFISFISMRDGFKLSSSTVYLIEALNGVMYQQDEVFDLAKDLLEKLKTIDPKAVETITKYAKGSIKSADDDWMHNRNYSPKIAETLRRKARKGFSSEANTTTTASLPSSPSLPFQVNEKKSLA